MARSQDLGAIAQAEKVLAQTEHKLERLLIQKSNDQGSSGMCMLQTEVALHVGRAMQQACNMSCDGITTVDDNDLRCLHANFIH